MAVRLPLTVGVVLLAQLGPGLAVGSVAALLEEAGQQRSEREALAGQLEELRQVEQPEQQPAAQAEPHGQRCSLEVQLQGDNQNLSADLLFASKQPVTSKRGEWHCVNITVTHNNDNDNTRSDEPRLVHTVF